MLQDEGLFHHGGSDNNYMRNKIRKLEKQGNNNDISASSLIFQGCHIFVNGYTQPSRSEIKHLVHLHGGTFESYQTSKTTHFICDVFPNVKLNELRKRNRDKMFYVTASWLTDSISSLCRLNEGLFQPPGLKNQHGSKLELPMRNCTNSNNVAASGLAESSVELNNVGDNTKSTLSDPDFLQHYYDTSRLHFIGSWKTRLPDLLAELRPIDSPHITTAFFAPNDISKRVVLHVDMDCFFVSALIRDKHHLQSVPVAVAHSRTGGFSEISSCNYPARSKGLKNGMMMAHAKRACPELVVLNYDFQLYEEISKTIYGIFFAHTSLVQPVSVDEAYLEFDSSTKGFDKAGHIRNDIWQATRCAASCGIGSNMLLARLATKKAKPNNQFEIKDEILHDILSNMQLHDFPGIGWKHASKLKDMGYTTCKEILSLSKKELQGILGTALGASLWDMCRGIDNRPLSLVPVRKSIGADVNYGIRFEDMPAAEAFLYKLCLEVARRLQVASCSGRRITLKLMKRHQNASHSPLKFLGHGHVETISRSCPCGDGSGVRNADELFSSAIVLFRALTEYVPATDLRGVGIQVTQLCCTEYSSSEPCKMEENTTISVVPKFQQSLQVRPSLSSKSDASVVDCDEIYIPSQLDEGVLSHLPSPLREHIQCMKHQEREERTNQSLSPEATQFTQNFLSHMPPELVDEVKHDLIQTKAQRSQRLSAPVTGPRENNDKRMRSNENIDDAQTEVLRNRYTDDEIINICMATANNVWQVSYMQWLVESLQLDKGVMVLRQLHRLWHQHGNFWRILLNEATSAFEQAVNMKYGCDIDMMP